MISALFKIRTSSTIIQQNYIETREELGQLDRRLLTGLPPENYALVYSDTNV
jgi:hypothetical protein